MEPKVSIIVPVYNAQLYLRQCVDSLIHQTYRNLEIILVDDGSSDDSPQICDEYAAADPRVIVIHKENAGAAFARKAGLAWVSGEYVLFSDSDDWMDVEAVEQLVARALQDQSDCVLFSYVKEFKHGSVENYLFENEFCYDAKQSETLIHQRVIGPSGTALAHPERVNNLSTTWGKLYRTHLARKGRIVSEREIGNSEDTLFNIYALDGCGTVSYVHKCFYHYRKYNTQSLTATYHPMLAERWDVFYRYIEEYIRDSGREEYRALLDSRIACGMIGLGLNAIQAPESFRMKVKTIQSILNRSEYIRAFRSGTLKNCSFRWKVYFLLCRYRCAFLLTVMLLLIEFIRTYKNAE